MKRLTTRFGRVSPALVVATLALFVALGGVSTAAQLDRSPQATAKKKPKVKRGPRGPRGLRGALGPVGAQGQKGDKGEKGDKGDKGEKGDKGDTGPVLGSGNWGTVDRNSIGSPVSVLRAGPVTTNGGALNAPPFGQGSLSILVGNDDTATAGDEEKAAYGNQVDFFGDRVDGVTAVGFRVWTSGENSDPGANNVGGGVNMPSIAFEIDPNLSTTPSNFSTMVWVPESNSPSNQWSGYLDATTTGSWFLTGQAGVFSGCNQTTTCTFAQLQDALDDGGDAATIYIAQITKGRDKAWQGAVDGLRINGEVFDFEEHGVSVRAA